jgi:osmotically inducible protein OsmC
MATLKRTSTAVWHGTGPKGQGSISTLSGALKDQPYGFQTRFASEDGKAGTNPEELIAAAHAGCFSMALSAALTGAGHPPTKIHTTASVKLEQAGAAFTITEIELETEGQVPGIDEATFLATAEEAKKTCPVSKALAGPHITLKAKFLGN